ncbi:hypothetical protein OROMI_009636 [Orobanche minor]
MIEESLVAFFSSRGPGGLIENILKILQLLGWLL